MMWIYKGIFISKDLHLISENFFTYVHNIQYCSNLIGFLLVCDSAYEIHFIHTISTMQTSRQDI